MDEVPEAAFVAEAQALLADPIARPTHVDEALPGSFGDLAEPHLLALEAARKQLDPADAVPPEQQAARLLIRPMGPEVPGFVRGLCWQEAQRPDERGPYG